jgi:hypothetical protein
MVEAPEFNKSPQAATSPPYPFEAEGFENMRLSS